MTKRIESHRPFLVIDLYHKPASGVRTERKGWGNLPGTWNTDENPRVVDRLTDKIRSRASVIIDLTDQSLVKNRFSETPAEEVVAHFMGKYAEAANRAVSQWAMQQALRKVHADALAA